MFLNIIVAVWSNPNRFCLKKELLATCNAITNHEAPSFNLSYCFLIYSMALANCAESMEKAKRDWYYEYNGIKAEISWITVMTLPLSTPFRDIHWIINSVLSFANDILLAAGIPRIPSTSNPTDKKLLITYPFGHLIAAWTFTKGSTA